MFHSRFSWSGLRRQSWCPVLRKICGNIFSLSSFDTAVLVEAMVDNLANIATLLHLVVIAGYVFVDFCCVPTLLGVHWTLISFFLELGTSANMLQFFVAVWLALWNFPCTSLPLSFILVVFVAIVNFRCVAGPLQFLVSLLPHSRPALQVPISAYQHHAPVEAPFPLPQGKDLPRFPHFLRLPHEIRRMIWAMALPSRVVELNIPEFAVRPGDCTFAWTSIANNKAPLVSRVCWEAHDVALKYCNRNSDKQRAKDLALRLPPPLTSNAGPMPVSLVWSSNNHPLVKPDRSFLWFNAARDTIILYHSPYWERRSAWFALQSRIALYGYLAADRAVYASMWNPWPRCMRHFYHHVLANAPAIPWADPIFVLRIVVIHATEQEARVSGLFGLAGDEPIQLIDPWDINLIMEFFWLTRATFREQGPSTVAFFEGLRANVGKWESQVLAWRRDAMTRELWLLWMKEYQRNFSGLVCPEDVFSGPKSRHGIDLDMRNPASYRTSLTHGPIDLEQYGPNENHPWVADVLASLPTFRYRIQFRHCALRCILAPTWLTDF